METSMCHCLAAVITLQVAIGSSMKGSIIGGTKQHISIKATRCVRHYNAYHQ